MDAALFQRFQPEEYYRRFLADGVRPDGRVPQERRRAKLQRSIVSSARGSSSVKLGNSAAVAGVRAEVTERTPEQAAVGRIAASVELPPLASAAWRERRAISGSLGMFLSNALTEVLNNTTVFKPDQLDIRESEIAWVLHVDVVVLNFDGNAFDICLLAALAALEDTTLPALIADPTHREPALTTRGAEVSTTVRYAVAAPDSDKAGILWEAKKLSLLSRPLPVTFAQLPGERWVVDPCAAEEGLGAAVSLCIVGGRWLVYHLGGSAGMERFLAELMPVARSVVPSLNQLLDGLSGGKYEASD
eukprot:TRINITY_DN29917_c0_g2_i1.p1 TRINITY_DN29917_c0_g2~~TRINITY_DN29917_c0_g2_i1.p1  ORF type:complete len:303 (+),score=75.90 TRINITY_DN29917_c0_g2_i1:158-1066(+)